MFVIVKETKIYFIMITLLLISHVCSLKILLSHHIFLFLSISMRIKKIMEKMDVKPVKCMQIYKCPKRLLLLF